jgi:hypothetical protein
MEVLLQKFMNNIFSSLSSKLSMYYKKVKDPLIGKKNNFFAILDNSKNILGNKFFDQTSS